MSLARVIALVSSRVRRCRTFELVFFFIGSVYDDLVGGMVLIDDVLPDFLWTVWFIRYSNFSNTIRIQMAIVLESISTIN